MRTPTFSSWMYRPRRLSADRIRRGELCRMLASPASGLACRGGRSRYPCRPPSPNLVRDAVSSYARSRTALLTHDEHESTHPVVPHYRLKPGHLTTRGTVRAVT